jgi:hypothetical protein
VKQIGILLFLLVVCSITAMQAQAQAPKPDPQVKKLNAVVGHWTFEGEQKPGPLGPGGKFAGEYTAQIILDGFFMQSVEKEKGAGGKMLALGIEAYDPVNKNFTSNWYYSDGTIFSGTLSVSGKTFTWAGKLVVAGKQYLVKEPLEVSPDLMSATMKNEISLDGITWVPSMEGKLVKVKPAGKE